MKEEERKGKGGREENGKRYRGTDDHEEKKNGEEKKTEKDRKKSYKRGEREMRNKQENGKRYKGTDTNNEETQRGVNVTSRYSATTMHENRRKKKKPQTNETPRDIAGASLPSGRFMVYAVDRSRSNNSLLPRKQKKWDLIPQTFIQQDETP